MSKCSYRDRDHLLTKEGLYFIVVGNVHPKDRIISYLKYYPKQARKRVRALDNLVRTIKHYDIPDLIESIKIVERKCPQYLHFFELYGFTFPAVGIENIKKHFIPEDRLSELLNLNNPDPLSKKAIDLTRRLSDESGISIERFGVTGSILLGIHDSELSDIDITVYGKKNCQKVKETLFGMFKENDATIKKVLERDKEFLLKPEKRLRFLSVKQRRIFYERKWNRGTFKGTFFSVNSVRTAEEITESYGDKKYLPSGLVEIEASVTDSSENMFIPAIYNIESVSVIKGSNVHGISELVSYSKKYCNLAEDGEIILSRGKLEKVVSLKNNESYYRVVVGSLDAKGMDYLKIKI